MLEEQDFKKIREEFGQAFESIVLPVLDKMNMEMVTKSYLDDKLADLEGSVIVRQKKEDKKLNLLIEFLQKKKILEESEIKMLKEFKIFPEMNLN